MLFNSNSIITTTTLYRLSHNRTDRHNLPPHKQHALNILTGLSTIPSQGPLSSGVMACTQMFCFGLRARYPDSEAALDLLMSH
jgi:hypothetical protein